MSDCQQLCPTIVRDIIAFSEDGTIKDVMDVIHGTIDSSSKFLNTLSAAL